MRIVRLWIALLLSIIAINVDAQTAEASFSCNGFEIKAGETKIVSVSMTSKEENIYGFQLRLTIPEELAFAPVSGTGTRAKYVSLSADRAPAADGYTITATNDMGGKKSAIVLSKNDNSLPYYGKSGVIFKFAVTASKDIAVGNHNIRFSDIEIVKNISAQIWPADFDVVARFTTDFGKEYALYDGTPYIQAYSVEDANISYTRTFNNNDWQPLYVPFEMSYEDWKEDFEVAYINNFHQFDTDGDDVMDEMQLEVIKVRSGSLYANYPYLIKAKTTGEKTLTFEGKTLYPSEENSIDCSSSTTKYTFTGTYSEIKGLKTKEYYVLSSAGLCMIDNDDVPLKPFRWYMKMEDRGSVVNSGAAKAKITSIQIVEADEDEATGIVANAGGEESADGNIYDMSGRKVSASERSSLSKGIYIKNNKKFIIK